MQVGFGEVDGVGVPEAVAVRADGVGDGGIGTKAFLPLFAHAVRRVVDGDVVAVFGEGKPRFFAFGGAAVDVNGRGFFGVGMGGDARESGKDFVRLQPQRGRRQELVFAQRVGALVAFFAPGGMLGEGVCEVIAGDVAAVRGQVVEEGRGFVVEKWQVVFEALRGLAVADLPVERAVGDFFAVVQAGVLAVADAASIGEVDFAARQDADVRVFFEGELAVHREGTDAVDVVIEPFEADGIRRVHRVEVDDAAACSIFAFAGDVDGVLVTRLFKAVDEVVAFEAVADAEMDAIAIKMGLRAEALAECGGAGNDNAAFTRRQFGKHAQALGDEVGMRGVLVVRQGFPVAEPVEVCGVIRPVFEVLVPVFGLAGIGGDEEVDVFAGEVAV